MLTVKCQKCGVELIFSNERALTCGRCGATVSFDAKPRRRRWFNWTRRLFPSLVPNRAQAIPELGGSNIKLKLDRLATAAWGTREEISRTSLMLQPHSLCGLDNTGIIGEMLRHSRCVAPRLNVPRMTPLVIVQSLCDAAGQFVEEDGWIKISVGAAFFNDLPAARAILCHELCHYVLNASGIREQPRSENERLTDAAMFVFGLGDLFLAGYRKKHSSEYRTGHRLGYLSDAEYQYAAAYVVRLRQSPDQFISTEQEIEALLRAIVHDPAKRARLIAGYRRKFSSATAAEVAQRIIADIAKDNR